MRRLLALVLLVASLTTTVGVEAKLPPGRPRGLPPFSGTISEIDRATRELMIGNSWHRGCPVPLRDLRLLRLSYVGFDGRADSSILIRTFTIRHGWIQCPVGGGIVAQSDPEAEYAETWHKAEGMLRALR